MVDPLPLHAFCARIVLCAPGATASNERSHKHADLIQSKCRSRLSSGNLEKQLLASIFMRKIVSDYARALEKDVEEPDREACGRRSLRTCTPRTRARRRQRGGGGGGLAL